jgi:hypothetical protein
VADEDPGVAVIKPKQPKPRAEPSEPPAEGCVAVEDEAEISPDDVCIRRERFVDPLERSGKQPAVGMKEQQHIAARRFGANSDPGAATGARDKGSHPAIVGNLERLVLAAAIHDNDLVGGPLLTNHVEQSRQQTLFIQGRDDNRDQVNLSEVQKYRSRAAVRGPGRRDALRSARVDFNHEAVGTVARHSLRSFRVMYNRHVRATWRRGPPG